jgi:HK97 family phage portal protein
VSFLRKLSAFFKSATAGWFVDWLTHASHTDSTVRITAESAQSSATVFACVQVRAQDIAKLPLILYRRLPDGGRQRATDHPLYNLLALQPNDHQTSFEWRETMQQHLDLHGNAYARINRDSRYRPVELIALHPHWVQVHHTMDGTVFYKLRMWGHGAEETLTADDILHLKDRSDDGICGKSVISRCREVIGLNVAGQKHMATLLGNGARLSGIISLKGQVDKPGRDLAKQEFNDSYGGVGSKNANGVAVFAEEGTFSPIQMKPADMDFIEQQKLSRQEIATIFRVPPHKVGIMDNATFSNIEHQSLEYVTDTLMPIARRWEMALGAALLRQSEQQGYFWEFLFDALLRGDFLSRMQGYDIQRRLGVSYNEIARRENWDAVPPEKGGDDRLVPLNMWPMDKPRPDKTQGVGIVDTPQDNQSAPPNSGKDHQPNVVRLAPKELEHA